MLYLGIDQHRKQLAVCVRDEQGDVTLRRHVGRESDRVAPGGFPRACHCWLVRQCGVAVRLAA